jgi:hypothetical protein
MTVRVAPASRGDADAHHLLGEAEQLEADARPSLPSLPEIHQVGLDRAAAARLEIDPAHTQRRHEDIVEMRRTVKNGRRLSQLEELRRNGRVPTTEQIEASGRNRAHSVLILEEPPGLANALAVVG